MFVCLAGVLILVVVCGWFTLVFDTISGLPG